MPQFNHCRGGMMDWIASPYSSLSSPWLPWTSKVFVSRSHEQLTHPLFVGLAVQVHLELWLFSLWLFVSSSAQQNKSCAASPCTPAMHSHPSTFQTHPNTTRAHYLRGLGINQLLSPSARKKLMSGTWKLWESLFCHGNGTQNPVIIC